MLDGEAERTWELCWTAQDTQISGLHPGNWETESSQVSASHLVCFSRFTDSPEPGSKGRGKRGRSSAAVTPIEIEPRKNLRSSKQKGKDSFSFPAPASPAKEGGGQGKRKGRPEPENEEGKKRKRVSSEGEDFYYITFSHVFLTVYFFHPK